MAGHRVYHDPEARLDLGPMNKVIVALSTGRMSASPDRQSLMGQPSGYVVIMGRFSSRLEEPPEPLRPLFVGSDVQALEFSSYITQYDSALELTSLGSYVTICGVAHSVNRNDETFELNAEQ